MAICNNASQATPFSYIEDGALDDKAHGRALIVTFSPGAGGTDNFRADLASLGLFQGIQTIFYSRRDAVSNDVVLMINGIPQSIPLPAKSAGYIPVVSSGLMLDASVSCAAAVTVTIIFLNRRMEAFVWNNSAT